MSFSSRQRIRASAAFDELYKKGRRAGDSYFGIVFRANGLGYPRLGMSVSVRSLGSAVARNRLRRLVRESFRLRQRELPALDVVITARAAARQAGKQQLRQSLESHWQDLIRKCAASS